MYYYIYDQFLSHKKYDKILAQIESKITDLGIKNRIIKMSILKSISELVVDALRKGAQTIVVAGNDQTFNQIVNLVAGQDIILGIIPIKNSLSSSYRHNLPAGYDNSIANFLGIHDALEACEIISARKIETVNLGEINNEYFINSVKIFDQNLKIECNNKFSITPLLKDSIIGVYNFAPAVNPLINWGVNRKFFNPQDNFLEVVVEPQDKKSFNRFLKSLIKESKSSLPDSIFRVKKVIIKNTTSQPGSVVVDNFKIYKTPLHIKISDKKLKVIVGKERKF